MNGQLMELWGRTLMTAMQGPNQMDMMSGWFQRTFQEFSRMNSSLFQMWHLPVACAPQSQGPVNWEQVWEPLLRMQELSMRWMGMVPQKDYEAQSQKISDLEEQVKEQARTIEKLQHLVSQSGSGHDQLVHQFQGLIDQQGRQFKQLTTSVGEFLRSGSGKTDPVK
jgi:uncharacterized coiled-coil protein SlyX